MWQPVGRPEEFGIGNYVTRVIRLTPDNVGAIGETTIYVRRRDAKIDTEPCHGGVYDFRGLRIGGPPARAPRRASRRRACRSSSAAVAVGDRHAPVAAEGLAGDLDARRALAALVLGEVDQADDAVDVGLGEAARDQLLAAEVLLDVALDDR